MVRRFSLQDCRNGDSLFAKARQFYKGVGENIPDEMALICAVPGSDDLRFIGEGCEDEFRILRHPVMMGRCVPFKLNLSFSLFSVDVLSSEMLHIGCHSV